MTKIEWHIAIIRQKITEQVQGMRPLPLDIPKTINEKIVEYYKKEQV